MKSLSIFAVTAVLLFPLCQNPHLAYARQSGIRAEGVGAAGVASDAFPRTPTSNATGISTGAPVGSPVGVTAGVAVGVTAGAPADAAVGVTAGAPAGAAAPRPSLGRTEAVYFYDPGEGQPLERVFALSEAEMRLLKKKAQGGDKAAGARLYEYYTYTEKNPALAEEAIESVPRGSGINDYFIKAFTFTLPNGEKAGSLLLGEDRNYLQKRQVVELCSLAASGNRAAAGRLSEYYQSRNETLAGVFQSFAKGDDSVLPVITRLNETFAKGDLRLVRQSFPTTLNSLWPF